MQRDLKSSYESLLAPINSPMKDEEEEEIVDNEEGGLGGKSIGKYGSFVYVVNQIFGPGMVAIPIVFQQSGWIPVLIVMVFFFFLSAWSATTLIEAMRMIPGNKYFQKRIEYSGIIEHYYGRKMYVMFQVFLNVCLQSINIASIIVCAQSVDSFLVFLFKETYSLQFYPDFGFMAGNADELAVWYGSSDFSLNLTLGYLIVMLFIVPWSFFPLGDNIKFQFVSFGGVLSMLLVFSVQFIYKPDFNFDQLPPIGSSFSQIVGVTISAWAFIMVVPSWVNEKKPSVSINKTIWYACGTGVLTYIGFGVLCALAYRDINSDNILRMMADSHNLLSTRLASYIFSTFIIAPGIPVYSISIRYNLYVGKVTGPKMSYFYGVIVPWVIGFLFTGSSAFASLLNWSGLIFTGLVNFVVPLLVYYKAYRMRETALRTFTSLSEDPEEPLDLSFSFEDSAFLFMFDKSFPRIMRGHTKKWIIALIALVTLLILSQIYVTIDSSFF